MRAVYRLSPKGEWGQTVGGIFFLLLFWNACANECLLSDTLAGLASLCVFMRVRVCVCVLFRAADVAGLCAGERGKRWGMATPGSDSEKEAL